MKILVVEDDALTAGYLNTGLSESGHSVDLARDGHEGLELAKTGHYNVLLVDRMMPGMNGLDLIQELRAGGVATPVLILSALSKVDERVRGLKAGGDDYLVKPFAFAELLARLEALVRRPDRPAVETRLKAGDLELDLLARTVTRAGRAIDLQPRTLRLLEYMMRHAGQVVTRTMLLEGVWDFHFDPQTNVIDVHMSRLRKAIEDGFESPLIDTVRGAGYRLRG